MSQPDLSKVINLIMENPGLVNQIKELAQSSEVKEETGEAIISSAEEEKEEAKAENVSAEAATYSQRGSSRRNELLRAMQPYLSKERGKAIETMITIADLLFTFKEK